MLYLISKINNNNKKNMVDLFSTVYNVSFPNKLTIILNSQTFEYCKTKKLSHIVLYSSFLGSASVRQLPPTIIGVQPNTRACFPLGLTHSSNYVKHRIALIGYVCCLEIENYSKCPKISNTLFHDYIFC